MSQLYGEIPIETLDLAELGKRHKATEELNALANVLKELRETEVAKGVAIETFRGEPYESEEEKTRTAVLKRIQELTK